MTTHDFRPGDVVEYLYTAHAKKWRQGVVALVDEWGLHITKDGQLHPVVFPMSRSEFHRIRLVSRLEPPITVQRPGEWSTDRKHDAGKPPWHLLPWEAAGIVVDVIGYGVTKYGRDTWPGVEPERYMAAAVRHLTAWRSGERLDAESGLPHLAHAACSVLFMLAIEEKAVR